jgi:hypothetical protein
MGSLTLRRFRRKVQAFELALSTGLFKRHPEGVVFNGTGSCLYVANDTHGTDGTDVSLSVIDIGSGVTLASIPMATPAELTRDVISGRVYIAGHYLRAKSPRNRRGLDHTSLRVDRCYRVPTMPSPRPRAFLDRPLPE